MSAWEQSEEQNFEHFPNSIGENEERTMVRIVCRLVESWQDSNVSQNPWRKRQVAEALEVRGLQRCGILQIDPVEWW